jgi:predicted nucleic acid-binding protein
LSRIVVDASIALAWCFPDETSEYADDILVALGGHTILVPAIWGLELANAILVGQRRKRLNLPEVRSFTSLLENLSIVQDAQLVSDNIRTVLPLAQAHGLSAYDAAYLELSIRHSARLATLDRALRKAARSSGIELFEGKTVQ